MIDINHLLYDSLIFLLRKFGLFEQLSLTCFFTKILSFISAYWFEYFFLVFNKSKVFSYFDLIFLWSNNLIFISVESWQLEVSTYSPSALTTGLLKSTKNCSCKVTFKFTNNVSVFIIIIYTYKRAQLLKC